MTEISTLQSFRIKYKPELPRSLKKGIKRVAVQEGDKTDSITHQEELKALFPTTYGQSVITFKSGKKPKKLEAKNFGVILSGGQAPGGHNVITGLYDALKKINKNNKLFGFLGGPSGIVDGKYIELDDALIDSYRNTGGFDMIGSGRTKLETEEQFMKVWQVCQNLNISGIVIIGGDDSNTNAALLAEWLKAKNAGICVVGCPKTIDGDLKNAQIETSFGFDTACKTYAGLVGNIQRDALSAKKYWHFVKLMGRSATHVGLEVALQTHPNITLISEEVEASKMSLDALVQGMVDVIVERAEAGKNYGVAVIPEGIIEFIPEMKKLITNLNDSMSLVESSDAYKNAKTDAERFQSVIDHLNQTAPDSAKVFDSLPALIKAQLLLDRDPHGNIQVSKIETEQLLINMIKVKLEKLRAEDKYHGKFSGQAHFFGYEGRCAFPSNFDANYCYALGYNACALLQSGRTGYISCIKNLTAPVNKWIAGGTPLTMMMTMEKRHGQFKPVIQKALVKLDGPVFKKLLENRSKWALTDDYQFPGAIQYYGPIEVTNATTKTLELEKGKMKQRRWFKRLRLFR